MYKQSAFVVSMLLGASASRDAPRSVSLFAEGTSPDEDLSVKVATGGDLEPEKVSVLETTKAGSHTSFYGQAGGAPAQAAHVQLAGDVYPEKVHITDEEYYRHRADRLKKPTYPSDFPEGMERTAFYSQVADEDILGAAPEKVSVPETTKGATHTSFYPQKEQRPHMMVQQREVDLGALPEKLSVLETTKGGNLKTFYAQQAGGEKVEPVGPGNIDPWVEEFSNENMSGISSHGQKPTAVHFAQKKKAFEGPTSTNEEATGYSNNGYAGWGDLGKNSYNSTAYKTASGFTAPPATQPIEDIAQLKSQQQDFSNGRDWNGSTGFINEEKQGYAANGASEKGWGNLGKTEMNSTGYIADSKFKNTTTATGVHSYAQAQQKDWVGNFNTWQEEKKGYANNGNSTNSKGWGDQGKVEFNSPEYFANSGFKNQTAPGTHYYAQKKDISEHEIDENVQDFANPLVDGVPGPRTNCVPPSSSNFAQKNKKDISEHGIEENVHEFASDNVDVLKWPRKDGQYKSNGTGANGWGDLGKNDMNSTAYYGNSSIPNPTPAYGPGVGPGHYEQRPAPNGASGWVQEWISDAPPPTQSHYYAQKSKKDISEHGIDENVHAFASDQVDVLKWPRVDGQYYPNGSGPKGWGDLGKNDMNSTAYYGHSGINNGTAPITAGVGPGHWATEPAPNGASGWVEVWHSDGPVAPTHYYAQKSKKDISEHGIDENVHDFASDAVDVLKWPRVDGQYYPNGTGPKGWGDLGKNDMNSTAYYGHSGINNGTAPITAGVGPGHWATEPAPNGASGWVEVWHSDGPVAPTHYYAQKDQADVKNSNIRPDVWKHVENSVDPTSHWRTDTPAPYTYETYNEQPIAKAACHPGAPVVEDAQVSDDGISTEKVHVLEPIAYQEKANTNTPNMRTTFYDKQNNLWKYDEKKTI